MRKMWEYNKVVVKYDFRSKYDCSFPSVTHTSQHKKTESYFHLLPLTSFDRQKEWGFANSLLNKAIMMWSITESFCSLKLLICIHFHLITWNNICPFTSYLQKLTLAGVWIQMAALNRMWSQSCFSSGAPCVRPSRYFAKERNCSNTALVMCTRDDCTKKHKVM